MVGKYDSPRDAIVEWLKGFQNHATPLILIRDCYEATVLTAFFYLLLMFLSPDPDEQRLIFLKHGLSRHNDAERMKKGEPVQKWVFPLWFVKWKPVVSFQFSPTGLWSHEHDRMASIFYS